MRNIEQIFLPKNKRNILMGRHISVVPNATIATYHSTKFPLTPFCSRCGKDMRVTRITPEMGFEQLTFECATCGDETVLMDPIRYGRETPWNPR